VDLIWNCAVETIADYKRIVNRELSLTEEKKERKSNEASSFNVPNCISVTAKTLLQDKANHEHSGVPVIHLALKIQSSPFVAKYKVARVYRWWNVEQVDGSNLAGSRSTSHDIACPCGLSGSSRIDSSVTSRRLAWIAAARAELGASELVVGAAVIAVGLKLGTSEAAVGVDVINVGFELGASVSVWVAAGIVGWLVEGVGTAVGILLACADGDMVGSRDDNVGVSVGFPVFVVDTDGTRLGSRVVLIVGFIVGAKVEIVGLRVAARAGTVGAEVTVVGLGVASEAVSSSEKETDSTGNDVGSGRASSDDFSSLLDDDETLEDDWELDSFIFFDDFLLGEDRERDFFVFFDDNFLLLSMCFLDCPALLLSELW
jgi:hypothetical protein